MTLLRVTQWCFAAVVLALLAVLIWSPPQFTATQSQAAAPVRTGPSIDELYQRQKAYNDRLAPRVMERIIKAAEK